MWRNFTRGLCLVSSLFAPVLSVRAAQLSICAEEVKGDKGDFTDEFSRGQMLIPAGAVFDYAGHAFGKASDPLDHSHDAKTIGWNGVTAAEEKRRETAFGEDSKIDQKNTSALITLEEARLSSSKPCAIVDAAAIISEDWGWRASVVFGSNERYYQLYGVMRNRELSTEFSDDNNPLDHAAARGEINAILQGTTDRTILYHAR